MSNARDEFMGEVDGKAVICAHVKHGKNYWDDEEITGYLLPVGHTSEDYEEFLKALNFEYDDGYGGQELYGTIWYADCTWSSRGEYDGSEWWEYNVLPEIPMELQPNASQAT